MSYPLEAAAKALCDVQQPSGSWERGNQSYRAIFMNEARAGITAYLQAAADDPSANAAIATSILGRSVTTAGRAAILSLMPEEVK